MPYDLDYFARVGDPMLGYRVTPEQSRAAVLNICSNNTAADTVTVVEALGLGPALDTLLNERRAVSA
jgi:hypothetical protein